LWHFLGLSLCQNSTFAISSSAIVFTYEETQEGEQNAAAQEELERTAEEEYEEL
jgi:hypothetical protein